MKYQGFIYSKIYKYIKKKQKKKQQNVIWCSYDWCFKGLAPNRPGEKAIYLKIWNSWDTLSQMWTEYLVILLSILTLNMLITTAADDTLIFFLFFRT